MANKMLIDASHPEETRVVVVRGQKVEEFDFESASRKQLRGNIYLAKVTRVEPSLQAAFVEYGGNRHGFLAFSEIHPDYYQIPVADRQALLEAEARGGSARRSTRTNGAAAAAAAPRKPAEAARPSHRRGGSRPVETAELRSEGDDSERGRAAEDADGGRAAASRRRRRLERSELVETDEHAAVEAVEDEAAIEAVDRIRDRARRRGSRA